MGPGDLSGDALSAVRFVVTPAEPGDLQIDGVAHALNHVAEMQARQNPDLEVLGVAVGKYRRGATRRMAEGRADLGGLLTDMDVPDLEVFEPWIRHTEAAEEMLRLGRVAIEHERIAEEVRRRRFEWLRSREGEQPQSLNVDGARGLADDYAAVISAVNDRFRSRLGASRVTMAAVAEAGR